MLCSACFTWTLGWHAWVAAYKHSCIAHLELAITKENSQHPQLTKLTKALTSRCSIIWFWFTQVLCLNIAATGKNTLIWNWASLNALSKLINPLIQYYPMMHGNFDPIGKYCLECTRFNSCSELRFLAECELHPAVAFVRWKTKTEIRISVGNLLSGTLESEFVKLRIARQKTITGSR